jgi:hypothetical protein
LPKNPAICHIKIQPRQKSLVYFCFTKENFQENANREAFPFLQEFLDLTEGSRSRYLIRRTIYRKNWTEPKHGATALYLQTVFKV